MIQSHSQIFNRLKWNYFLAKNSYIEICVRVFLAFDLYPVTEVSFSLDSLADYLYMQHHALILSISCVSLNAAVSIF